MRTRIIAHAKRNNLHRIDGLAMNELASQLVRFALMQEQLFADAGERLFQALL